MFEIGRKCHAVFNGSQMMLNGIEEALLKQQRPPAAVAATAANGWRVHIDEYWGLDIGNPQILSLRSLEYSLRYLELNIIIYYI